MAEQSVFARIEKKYLLDEAQARMIADALRRRAFYLLDFGDPAVQSLYYDTPDFCLIRRSLERPNYKEKLRLRVYGQPAGDGRSYVEIKKKYRGVVYKRRVELPLGQAVAGIESGHMPPDCGQIGREIDRCVAFYALTPKCVILYDRDAWISDGEDVRVTFDRRVRCRFDGLDVTLPQEGETLLPEDRVLMEVKVPGAYPLWLSRLLYGAGARPVHFSKYGAAYTRCFLSCGGAAAQEETKEADSIA